MKKFSSYSAARIVGVMMIASVFSGSFAAPLACAQSMSSSNYKLESDSVNFSGGRAESSSYSLENTAGEVGTGPLTGTTRNAEIGFQQTKKKAPAPAAAAVTQSTTTPPLYMLVNLMNFTVVAQEKNILLTWQYPENSGIVAVRIVRSKLFYPLNPSEGEIIFEGNASQVVDNDVVPGTTYYYALFAQDKNGEFSSGVLARARIPLAGDAKPAPGEDPFAHIPQAENVDQAIASLTLADFDFIQDGRKIEQTKKGIVIDAKKNLTVRLDYAKVPQILKTIAVTLAHPSDPDKVFTFLLRTNEKKTAYEATIAPLEESGLYTLHAIVLDYENQGLKRFNGQLRAVALVSAAELFSGLSENPRLLYGMILALILAFIAILFFVIHNRRRRELHKELQKASTTLLLFFVLFGMMASPAYAVVNREINYQGKLTDDEGEIVAGGPYTMEFKLYTSTSSAAAIWTETHTGANEVTVRNGLFSVLLGQITSLDGVDFNQTLYLGINVNSDGEMTPRKKIGAVPAAFVADKLDGLDSTQFLRSDTGVVTQGYYVATTTTASVFPYASTTGLSVLTSAYFGATATSTFNSLGRLGILSASPSYPLEVLGAGRFSGFADASYFVATSSSATSTFAGGITGPNSFTIQQNSGYLGIGTTSPSRALSVEGSSLFNGNMIIDGAGSSITFTGSGNHDIVATSGTLRIGSNTIIGNIEALDTTIDIGTPAVRFDKIYAEEVNATTLVGTLTGGNLIAETLTINSDNASADTEDGFLVFERGSLAPNAVFSWDATNDEFDFNSGMHLLGTILGTTGLTLDGFTTDITTGTNQHLVIAPNGTGNVGIGTTSPYAKLSVVGPVVAEYFTATSTTATSTFAGGLAVETSGLVYDFTTNNVGIGTTSPASALHIVRTGASTEFAINTLVSGQAGASFRGIGSGTTITTAGNAGSYLELRDTSGTNNYFNAIYGQDDGATNLSAIGFVNVDPTNNIGDLSFLTRASGGILSEKMRILGSGNIGIGTSSPWAQLSINPNGITGPAFAIGSSTATSLVVHNSGKIVVGATSATSTSSGIDTAFLSIERPYENNTAVRIIGGNNTRAALEVRQRDTSGTLGVIAIFADEQKKRGLTFQYASSTNTFKMFGDYFDAGPSAEVVLGTFENRANQLYLATSGNVGIGTTSPYARLSVSGSGVFTGGDVLASTLTATSSISSPSLTLTAVAINSLLATNASGVVGATSTPTFGNFNATSTTATSTIATGGFTVGSSQFVVQQNSGNVGIGTTSPGQKLSVAGDILGSTIIGKNFTATSSTSVNSFAGSVGVGTTSPMSKFSVNGDITVTNSGAANVGTVHNAVTSAYIQYLGGTDWTNGAGLYLAGNTFAGVSTLGRSDAAINPGDDTASIRLQTYSGTDVLTMKSFSATQAGIGISSTSPYAKLSVTGTNTASTTMAIRPVAGQTANILDIYSTSGILSSVISAAGNVGLGTTSPYARLSVEGSSALGNSATAGYFVATTSTASIFPYASTTAISSSGSAYFATSGGNVGIGTTTPSSRLTIGGGNSAAAGTDELITVSTTGNARLWLNADTDNVDEDDNPCIGFGQDGTTTFTSSRTVGLVGNANADCAGGTLTGTLGNALLIDSNNQGAIHLNTGATTFAGLTVADTTGNVGIGTTTPNNILDLYSTTKSAIGFSGASGSTYKWTLGMDVTNGGRFSIASSTALGTTDRFVIDGSGNVGIGTTTPLSVFHVAGGTGTTDSGFRLAPTVGGNRTLVVDGGQMNVRLTNVNAVSAVAHLTLQSDSGTGNVGIGTTSPYAKLSVAGSGVFTGGDVLASTFTATSSISSPSLTLTGVAINSLLATNASGVVVATSTPTFGNFNATSTTATSTISTGGFTVGGSQFVVQQTSGNVGIGSTTPEAALTVNTTSLGPVAVLRRSGGAGAFTIDINNINTSNTFADVIFAARPDSGANSGGIVFKTKNGTSAVTAGYFDPTGNLGIGTTTPWGKLVVTNTGSGPSFIVEDATSPDTTPFIIDASGNVGIGTTTPSAKSDIFVSSGVGLNIDAGAVGVDIAQFRRSSSANVLMAFTGSSGDALLTFDSSNRPTWSTGIDDSLNGYVISENSIPGTNDYFVIKSGGNVGIGTTSPYAKLSVVGGIVSEYLNATSTTATSTFSGGAVLALGAGNVGIGLSNTSYKLHVSVSGTGSVAGFTNGNGTCTIDPNTTSLSCSSDASLKKEVSTLSGESALRRLGDVRAVSYRWNNQTDNVVRYGVIAQELENVFPEFVTTGPNGLKSVSYGAFTPLLVSAIQELDVKISALASTTELLTLGQPGLIAAVSAAFEALGTKITDGLLAVKNFTAETFTLGSKEKPAGITLFDEITGTAYCVKVSGGSLVNTPGACTARVTATTTPVEAVAAAPVSSPAPAASSAPVVTTPAVTEPVATSTPSTASTPTATTTPVVTATEAAAAPAAEAPAPAPTTTPEASPEPAPVAAEEPAAAPAAPAAEAEAPAPAAEPVAAAE